jgi:hypothetical protein
MGDAIDCDRFQTRVAEDDFMITLRGRVALEGGLHVLFEHQPQIGKALEQLDRLLLADGFEIGLRLLLAILVAQGAGDLLGEFVVQAVDQVADVVLDVAQVQVLPTPITGIKNIHQVGDDFDDGVATGQRFMAEMAGAAALGIGGDNRFGDFRQGFLQANIRGHGRLLIGSRASASRDHHYRRWLAEESEGGRAEESASQPGGRQTTAAAH